MTVKQLSDNLQYVKGEYLEAAWRDLHSTKRGRSRRLRQVIALAAVIAALLALGITAMAANWFGLRDLLLPQKIQIDPPAGQTPYFVDAITLAGFYDTPESQAAAQWQAFLDSYGTEYEDNHIFAPETCYSNYQVYDQTMADKLDEIAARFQLKLHTQLMDITAQELCEDFGSNFLGAGQGSGYIYEDGSFHLDVKMELPGYGKLDYQLTRCVRGTLTETVLNVNDITQWQEWIYTTQDGQQVTLGLSSKRGLIIAQLPDSFVTVNVLTGAEVDPDSVFSSGPIGREEIEALAECFDFSALTPAKPVAPPIPADGTYELSMLRTYENRREAYAYLLNEFLTYRIFPDGTTYEAFDDRTDQFALADVNGDGAEELLLCATNTYTAGQSGYVIAFDEVSGQLRIELHEGPMLTFYKGGIAKAEASHNQGLAGDVLWPYTLYRYDAVTKTYQAVAMVDAWDSQLADTYMGNDFPASVDTSKTGVVYYVMDPHNYVLEDPMDLSDYEAWYSGQLGTEGEISVDWQPLTEDSIRRLRGS